MDGSNVCQLGTGQEDDWKSLYESAFPLDERTPVDDLRKFMTQGSCLLHRTTNKSGELLCFSVVNMMRNFAVLAYIATDSSKRSTGVGSKHLKQLIDTLKQSHPNFIGLFLEIESTKEPGLDDETLKQRSRRLAFYQRLGAKRMLDKKYHMPACSGSAAPRAGELLWIELKNSCITAVELPKVIAEIFEKGYLLKADNPVVKEIVEQWPAPAAAGTGNTVAIDTTTKAAADQTSVAREGASTGRKTGFPCACAEDPPPTTIADQSAAATEQSTITTAGSGNTTDITTTTPPVAAEPITPEAQPRAAA